MGLDPQHVLEAQRRLERNRKPQPTVRDNACLEGEEVEKLHNPTKEWLKKRGIAFVYNRPDRASTATEGAPDFTIACGVCCIEFVEFKTKTGKLTAKQQEWHFLARRAGVEVNVFRSMDEFYALMKEIGVE